MKETATLFPIYQKIPTNPVEYRSYGDEFQTVIKHHQEYVKATYIAGLIHPDLAVQNQIPVKLYSDVPLPTATIGFHEQYAVQPNAGNILISWRPNVLTTASKVAGTLNATGNITINTSGTLTGSSANAFNYFRGKGYYPNVGLQKFRLVSALLRVSYNGSVLNQSGTLLSCATFDNLGIGCGTPANDIQNATDPLVDRFGNFNLVQNGLWNRTVNITEHSSGLECLYVPMDPDDKVFQTVDTYYGSQYTAAGTVYPDIEGAHINYIVAGKNLPNTNCILVDCYYNYEVIADPSSAAILRSDSISLSRKEAESVTDTLRDGVENGLMIRETKGGLDWKSILNDIIRTGITYIPKLLSMV